MTATTDPRDVVLQPMADCSTVSLQDNLSYRLGNVRFLVLAATSLMMYGSYYFFDQCSASKDAVQDHLNITDPQFGLLQAIYSWPNTVLPLFGGVLIDSFGIRKSMILFMSFVALGQVVYTLGLSQSSYFMALLGRALFGLGGESLNVSSLAMISLWFKGKELAFSMGIVICVSRLGSVTAFNTQELLIESSGVTEASFMGTLIMAFACAACVVACTWDKRADVWDAKHGVGQIQKRARSSLGLDAAGDPQADPHGRLELENTGGMRRSRTNAVTSGTALLDAQGGTTNASTNTEESKGSDDMVNFTQLFDLGVQYWLITFCCVTVYISAFPFFQVTSTDYLKQNFNFGKGDANMITSLPNLVSAFTGPFLGLFVDRFGRRPYFLIGATLVFIGCYLSFVLYGTCDECWSVLSVYICLGLALCLFGSVMWPCIPLVVDDEMVGSAFGVTTAVQNLGLGLAPLLFMELKSHSGSGSGQFTSTFVSIILSNVFALVAAVILLREDKRTGSKLQKP